MPAIPIQSLKIDQVYQAMETSPDGLSEDEAISRLALYGNNILSEHHATPLWHNLILRLRRPIIWTTFLIGIILLILGDWIAGLIIWVLAFVNTFFSIWREYRAEKAIEKLQLVLPIYAHVIRAGEELYIPAQEIVPGDILVLAEGDNIAADARVVEEFGLRTNNASLTGESIAARKMADESFSEGHSEIEQSNLVFAGTSVASGTGKAVVYATGMMTQFGRIAHLTQSIQEVPTQLTKELNRLIGILTWIAFGIGGIVAAVGYLDPATRSRIFNPGLLALGIMVAMTPEGLPATLTLTLAAAAQRLALRDVLVKKLSIIETLGNVSVICTDKSGTLTQNQMTVREVWTARQRLRVTGVGYEPKGKYLPSPKGQPFENDLMALLDAAASCNNARINPPSAERPTWTSLGDQTEAALKVAAFKSDVNEAALEILYPRVHEIPFDARRKRMTTIHREMHKEVAFTKGAPREILQLCTRILINDQEVPLTNEIKAEIMAANDDYARNALRVLALARHDIELTHGAYTVETVERDLTFLGLMAMMDPPRPEVEKAIKICREADIRIVMITGDYGLTAESLARRIGMLSTANTRILTGAELDEISDFELQRLLIDETIFARMAPEHKMRLVSTFQARGEVVAVTGDGVNDAPALRKADVGVAMGLVGTDVAKEAADIILTKDNFGAIVAAIEEGRAIFENIRKFITYIFTSNVPEIVPFLFTAAAPVALALKIRQVLAVDIGTDILPALGLGMEKPEPDIMQRPPRKKDLPLIDRKLLWRVGWLGAIETGLCYGGFLIVFLLTGHIDLFFPIFPHIEIPSAFKIALDTKDTIYLATTVYFAGLVMAQIGNAYACRSETLRSTRLGWVSNRIILYGIGVEVAIMLFLIYVPFVSELFLFIPIPLKFWAGLIFYPLIIYGLEWLRKTFVRMMKKSSHNHLDDQKGGREA